LRSSDDYSLCSWRAIIFGTLLFLGAAAAVAAAITLMALGREDVI